MDDEVILAVPSPDKQINSSPEEVESPQLSTKGTDVGLDAKRFYGRLNVKETKVIPTATACVKQRKEVTETRKRRPSKKTTEHLNDSPTDVVSKKYKRCKEKKSQSDFSMSRDSQDDVISSVNKKSQSDFNMSRDSQDDVISSVELSQTEPFMDTPAMDETPMCDRKVALCKSWVQQLNDKLENIEAVANKKQVSEVYTGSFYHPFCTKYISTVGV